VITATSFSGNGSGLTGVSAGIGTTGSVNTSGIITATSFSGNGSGLTGVSAGIGTTGSVNTSGIITATSFSGSGSALTGVGKILQVVQATTSTATATSSTSYTDTTLSASITPSSASNKILVIISQSGHVYSNQTAIHEVIQALGGRGAIAGDISHAASVSVTYLDSPSTTSSVTYKTQAKISNADSNYTTQVSNSFSVITLLEVAA
jgi:hypothetical protein